jgi:hypothetical protein
VTSMGGELSAGPDSSGGFTVEALLPIPTPATSAVEQKTLARHTSVEGTP